MSDTQDARITESFKRKLTESVILAIGTISDEDDRESVVAWFANARQILLESPTKAQAAKSLYKSTSSRKLAVLLGKTVRKGASSYWSSDLSVAMKVAMPVGIAGALMLGGKGVGIAAFGNAIGLPVALVLFIGVAGVSSIVETFVGSGAVRGPIVALLATIGKQERDRRASKKLLQTLKQEAETPLRHETPLEGQDLLAELQRMDPIVFERHVMSLFECDGFPTGVTKCSNDFGVDGYVLHTNGVVVVQCKRYSADNPVGRPAVQQFKGVVEEQQALLGFVVTTSTYTTGAQESASKSDKLILVDQNDLIEWHNTGSDWTSHLC